MAQSDQNSIGNEQGYGPLVRSLGRKTRKILSLFQKEDYINSVAKDMKMSFNGVLYHAEKLQEKGLITETGEMEGRTYYKTTEKGDIILDKVNIPE